MEDLKQMLNQCRKPEGDYGKTVIEGMNVNHFELTGWGLKKIDIKNNSIVLDVGCGGGKTIARIAEMTHEGKVYGIDYSSDCVKWSKDYNKKLVENGKVEVTDASVDDLPFADNMFDIVTAVETIYFWPDLIKDFCEIKRVLKPSGKFIVINEMYKNGVYDEKNVKYAEAGNMKMLTPDELKDLFKKTGYGNIEMHEVEENDWVCCIGTKK